MSYIETIEVYSLITLFSLPILGLLGSPMVLLGIMVLKMQQRFSSKVVKISIAAIPIALGIAPVYAHTSALPLYIILIAGGVTLAKALLSFSVTWMIVFGFLFLWCRDNPVSEKNV